MASGPTQNYDDPTLVAWRPHPALARALRLGLAALPATVAVVAGLLAVRLLPPARVGLHPWLWLVLEVAASAVLLLAVGRLARRLLPLATLLRLSLVLPDQVPSRLAAIRCSSSPEVLRSRVESARGDGAEPDAALLIELVSALSRHDRATYRHSERVQAYATLIGLELGLTPLDTARLGWAALLHDVGKLTVPTDVLNKPARPDPDEWAAISGHAEAGGALAAPLARWLGPWAAAIDQHHERWDGAGYPRGLAGEQISAGARIVAVADAFDVITSARAYKAPLPPDAARAELARCAGTQFDPQVVRAFLAVGLGELRAVVGPVALLGALPALGVVRQGAARAIDRAASAGSAITAAAPGVATAVVVGAGLAAASPAVFAPTTPAAEATTVRTQDAAPDDGDGRATVRSPRGEGPSPADDPAETDGEVLLDGPIEHADTEAGAATPGADDAHDADGDPTDADKGGGTTPAAPDDPHGTPAGGPDATPGPALPPTASDAARDAVGGAVGADVTPGDAVAPAQGPGRANAE